MEIGKAKVVFYCALLITLFWASPVVSQTTQKVMIIPPNTVYVAPSESNRSEDPLASFHSTLGRNIFFNMKASIETFNNLKQSRIIRVRYRILNAVAAVPQDNFIVQQFHDRVSRAPKNHLDTACKKYHCDLIAWVEFDSDYAEKLSASFEKAQDCSVRVVVKVYESDGRVRTRGVDLHYKHAFSTFSGSSQRAITWAMVEILRDIHFDGKSS